MYQVIKTFGHGLGLSACFRQWRATSHCNKLHGYALSIEVVFECATLDARNWVIDFGGLKELKRRYEDTFDHKTLVAADDPDLLTFKEIHQLGIIDMVMVPGVGCELFSKYAYGIADEVVQKYIAEYAGGIGGGSTPSIRVAKVTVREHESNAAVYIPDNCASAKTEKYPESDSKEPKVTVTRSEDSVGNIAAKSIVIKVDI